MESSSSFIEVKVNSGKDLRAFNFFQKLQLYVQVYVTSDVPNTKLQDNQIQKQRTSADKEGDANPEWNHSMRFDFDHHQQHQQHLFLQFDLRHEGNMFGDKTIGQVRVPFIDLIEDSAGVVRFVSYEVRSPDGKPNGVLNFSYKVVCASAVAVGKPNGIGHESTVVPQITGYPIQYFPVSDEFKIDHQSGSPKIRYPTIDLGLQDHQDIHAPSYPVHKENAYYNYSRSESFNHPPVVESPPPPASLPHGGYYPHHHHPPPPLPPPPPQPGFHPWGAQPHPHPHPNPYGYGYGSVPHGPVSGGHMDGWPNPNYWHTHSSSSPSSWNGR